MKKLQIKLLFSLFLTIYSNNLFAQVKQIIVNKDYIDKNSVILLDEKQSFTTLKFNINELNLIETKTDYGIMYKMESGNAPFFIEEGVPELVYLPTAIIIPDIGSIELDITYGKYVEIENIEIAPSKGSLPRSLNPETIPYKKGVIYEKDAFFPGVFASPNEPFIMRDIRGQTIFVYPVQYNPVTKTIRIYSEITVTVNYTQKSGLNEFTNQKRHSTIDPEFSSIYSSLFINHSNVQTRVYPTEEEGDLLIICHPTFMDAMKPYVNWKRSIGRNTAIISTSVSGTTAVAIKSYISNYYNSPSNNLAYVLLVGDFAQVPPYVYTNNGGGTDDPTVLSDNYFGQLVGSDNYMEILVGRFSSETVAHVQTQVQRTIWYERDINTTNTWLSNAIGIATNEGSGGGHDGGEADHIHMNNIRTRLLNYGYYNVYQEYGANSGVTTTSASQISSRFNTGVGVANYCNHGAQTCWALKSGSSYIEYNTSHVSSLSNAGRLPFIFSVACLVGRFNYSQPCFAEAWMRATQSNQPTGAIATLMASISLNWLPPMTAQDEFANICMGLNSPYSGTQPGIKRTFAGAAINATQKMLIVHGTSKDYLEDFDSWTVFGDPTLMIRTKTPQSMSVSHSSTIQSGSNSFAVSCNVAGALVTMSYTDSNDNVCILGTSTVSNGIANITFSHIVPLIYPIKITITGRDRVTYQGTINVVCTNEFFNHTVMFDAKVEGCNNLNVKNVTVTNNAKLTLDAPGNVTINGPFKVELGSSLKVK